MRFILLIGLAAFASVDGKKVERRQGAMAQTSLEAGAMAALTSLAGKYDCHVQKGTNHGLCVSTR